MPKISLFQWNINDKTPIESIVIFLKQQQTDIICLQELTIDSRHQKIKDTPKYIADALDYDYYYGEAPIRSEKGVHTTFANGIFSRFPITFKQQAWTVKREIGDSRVYVEVDIDINDEVFTVGTTHMSYTHEFKNTSEKKLETDALIRQLSTHNKRFIFCADLNAAAGSYTIDQIKKHLKNAGPAAAYKTWTTKPFSYNGFEESELNWRLDYVFVTKDIDVLSAEVITTDLSDHLPLKVEFKV